MKKTTFATWFILAAFITLTVHAEDTPDFWFLQGAEPTPENRLHAVQNAGKEYPDKEASESFVEKTGVEMLARRWRVTGKPANEYFDDVIYVFANTKEDAKPLDDWFRLRELRSSRDMGHEWGECEDGTQWIDWYESEDDRAFFMDPTTGKIGEAAVRKNPETNWLEIRIQMKPGETLAVRIVCERWGDMFRRIGFEEFESLPAWEYTEPQS